MKLFLTALLILQFLILVAQRPSEKVVSKEKYTSNTEWSCADKHFGYYYLNYLKPIALEASPESEIKSGLFTFGYIYRYKIVQKLDFGAELSFSNRKSVFDKDFLPTLDPGTFYSKVFTFHNALSGGMFFRVNLFGQTHRNLGAFIDFGGNYIYSFSYGAQYVLKNSTLHQKTRFRKPYYLSPVNYEVYFRAGYNNLALIVAYDFGSWITEFSSQDNNYTRSPLLIGIQLNLYAK